MVEIKFNGNVNKYVRVVVANVKGKCCCVFN